MGARCSDPHRRKFADPLLFTVPTHDSFRMIAASILPKVGYGNENPPTDPPRRQTFRRHKVVEPTLANRKKLSGLFTAHQQFVFRCNSDSLWRLPAISLERWLLPRRLQSASVEINDPLCRHSPIPCTRFSCAFQPVPPASTTACHHSLISPQTRCSKTQPKTHTQLLVVRCQ